MKTMFEALTEARNIIDSARLVVAAYEQDDYSSIKQAIQELADEFKRVEGE